ncbi:MAG TPA: twin-arginine translocase TatA/TatE family subunit [Dehalococcoidia bacterium]|jgi:Sec-independent protein translocase protein TatA|nr:twin-arginine translocase TatA/TatE family subunit [Dehalococcoidia bacterium]
MLGMGSMEILVILLISFLLLGPQKMISGARMLGDLISEAKRFAEKIPHIDVDNSATTRYSNIHESKPEGNSSEADLGQNTAPPIAFQPRRKKIPTFEPPELLGDKETNNKKTGNEDESDKSPGR